MFGFFRNLGNKMKRTLLSSGEDIYNDEYYDDDEYDDEDEYYETDPMQDHYTAPAATSGRKNEKEKYRKKLDEILGDRKNSGVEPGTVPFNGPASYVQAASVIVHPKVINDCPTICEEVVDGKLVIVDLTGLNAGDAQRIADYLGGVAHTMSGQIKRINHSIFALAPKEFHIVEADLNAKPPLKSFKAR